jgi:hypothetical protein
VKNRNGRISIALLTAALALFVTFHLLPGFNHKNPGWKVWARLWRDLQAPEDLLRYPEDAVIIFCILNVALLIVAAPFLTQVWLKSRLAWWFATTISGLVAGGYLGGLLVNNSLPNLGSGGWCLLIALILNFTGLLLARPQWLKKSGVLLPPGSESAV